MELRPRAPRFIREVPRIRRCDAVLNAFIVGCLLRPRSSSISQLRRARLGVNKPRGDREITCLNDSTNPRLPCPAPIDKELT